MPTHLFEQLKAEKKLKIIAVGISEFALYGYTDSSTNRIVKACGISKGSLFLYFQNKEDFYFYILDLVANEMISDLDEKKAMLPTELFERIIAYAELEFSWYLEHPEKYRFILNAFSGRESEIYQKTEVRYGLKGKDIYYKLLETVDETMFGVPKQKILDMLKWVLKGFQEDFLNSLTKDNMDNIDDIRQVYVREMAEYMELLKLGLFKGKGEIE